MDRSVLSERILSPTVWQEDTQIQEKCTSFILLNIVPEIVKSLKLIDFFCGFYKKNLHL